MEEKIYYTEKLNPNNWDNSKLSKLEFKTPEDAKKGEELFKGILEDSNRIIEDYLKRINIFFPIDKGGVICPLCNQEQTIVTEGGNLKVYEFHKDNCIIYDVRRAKGLC